MSALPDVDPYGWSAQRFSPWFAWLNAIEVAADPDAFVAWMDAHRDAADESWTEQVLGDLDSSPVLAELVARHVPLAIEPAPTRELEGATA